MNFEQNWILGNFFLNIDKVSLWGIICQPIVFLFCLVHVPIGCNSIVPLAFIYQLSIALFFYFLTLYFASVMLGILRLLRSISMKYHAIYGKVIFLFYKYLQFTKKKNILESKFKPHNCQIRIWFLWKFKRSFNLWNKDACMVMLKKMHFRKS